MKCKFTEIIHGKGWTAWDACKHWGIRYDVWRRKCRNVKLEAQLLSMCKGLEDRNDQEIHQKTNKPASSIA